MFRTFTTKSAVARLSAATPSLNTAESSCPLKACKSCLRASLPFVGPKPPRIVLRFSRHFRPL